ncbi:pre-toxin TG domain-containing protein [Micromonospora sp. NPDC005254]|uniref:pre-toxin TG domain-containing protein n=1 Tax=Micromonospora sp. NPDC005254 TaxID=3364229 RepID=UPI003698C45E
MAIDLGPYRRMLTSARVEFEAGMTGGRASAFELAVLRGGVAIMAEDLARRPDSLAAYEHRKEGGLSGPELWKVTARRQAAAPLRRRELTPEAFTAKNNEYLALMRMLRERATMPTHLVVDRTRKRVLLVQEHDRASAVPGSPVPPTPSVPDALDAIAATLAAWVMAHQGDDDFLTLPAAEGMSRMLAQRQDLLVTLRIAQQQPTDTNSFPLPVEHRPAVLEVVEFGIALIPVVGTAVAIFEAAFGYDIFGYELTEVDRCIIAAGVLLPFASRFVKGGRALYTAARMERLYGLGAARWSLALAAGEKVSEDVTGRLAISEARTLIAAGKKVDSALAARAVTALERMGVKRGSPRGMSIATYVADSLKKLVSGTAVLSELDHLALMRVVEKGPNINLMKGQLLEEFLEARIAAWLRDPAGARALGIHIPAPQTLEFIPGHMIRDASGRQLTDGILAHRQNGELIIVAIFEAKAGRHAARELKIASGGISSLSQAERAELRAYARDVLRARNNRARLRGEKFPTRADEVDAALDRIEREVVLSEEGGQVRRDIERLAANEDGTAAVVQVGEEFLPVRVSPKDTKLFGVLPRDVPVGNMQEQLTGLGYNFEVLGMNVTQKELVDLSNSLRIHVPPEHLLGPAPLLPRGVPGQAVPVPATGQPK